MRIWGLFFIGVGCVGAAFMLGLRDNYLCVGPAAMAGWIVGMLLFWPIPRKRK